MDVVLAAVGILLAYLVGSIPFAYILVRLTSGTDIRTQGTGNVGALNVYQHLGPMAGAAVLLADVGKGVVAVYLPLWLGGPDWARFGGAFAVIAGHNWPVFLGFRGGKGAASLLGVGFALAPPLAAIALIPVSLGALVLRNVVIGVAFGFLLYNILIIATGKPWDMVAVCLVLSLAVVANYLAKTLRHMIAAIRQRQWRAALYRE